jgi:cellulose synthase/poly-beta-1,6-N-acetylglucosamine synthase-like glycosyltransferase
MVKGYQISHASRSTRSYHRTQYARFKKASGHLEKRELSLSKQPEFSIVVPVFNEIDCLQEMHQRVADVMNSTGETWEMIIVDDGSRDGSTEQIRELGKKFEYVNR